MIQGVVATIEHLHLQRLKFVGEGVGHYLRSEGVVRSLDQLVNGCRGLSFQGFPQCQHLLPYVLHFFLLRSWDANSFFMVTF